MQLSDHLIEVMKDHLSYNPSADWMTSQAADPDDYIFTTPGRRRRNRRDRGPGTAIDEQNFYNREWKPMLRRLKIRPRPFYNTRHSYTSFMLSSGHSAIFVSKQTGDSIKTLETNYARYLPEADSRHAAIEASIRESADTVRTVISAKIAEVFASEQKEKSPRKTKGLKMERVRRVELPTLCLASIRSSQLSYTRMLINYSN